MNKQLQNSSQPMPGLSIRLMGKPQIYLGGNELVHFQYRKSMALVAFLIASERPYSREYLADHFWRNLSEKNAQAGLRKTLADINKVLPQVLSIENQFIALPISPSMEVDALTFEKSVLALRHKPVEEISDTAIKQLEKMLVLCQDPFMDGFFVQNAPDFDHWITIQREHKHNLLIEALLILSDYMYSTGQVQESMDYARRLLRIEPAQEEAHFKLMSLFALNGQRTMALNQYELCKQALYETYGSLPKQKMVDLYNRICSEQETKAPARTLPIPTMPIYGREEDIQHVLSRLAQDHCRILTITGPGGIGKTHLALSIGNEINRGATAIFEDGVVFVSLQALKSIHSLSSSIAYQLGYSYEKESDPVKQLCDFLAPYKMVLILDNFEQLVFSLQDFQHEQYDLINRILQAAPGVKLLITSRIRLNFQGEYIYPLHGIAFPQGNGKEADQLRQYPAVSLFIQRAEQLTGQYNPDEHELQGIIDICQYVNGLPLGILLAAGWTNLLTAGEIAGTINNGKRESGLEFLATGGQDMPERHRDMDSVFRQSWDMLSAGQQEVLAALSIFPSSFSVEAAREIARAELADLKVLLDHSLLERSNTGRLQMHDLLRHYAGNQGMQVSGVYQRTCQYYSAKVVAWEQAIKGNGQAQAIDEMNLEIDNLRAIWEWVIANDQFMCANKMFEGFCHYFTWRHYYAEAVNFCEHLVQQLESAHEFNAGFSRQDVYRLMAKALTWQASFMKLDEGGAYLSRSMQILDDAVLAGCDTRSEKAFACYWMAANTSQTGNFDQAMRLYDESKSLYESLQDEWHLKNVYLASGIMLWDKSEYTAGRKMVEESLAISRKIGDQRGIAHAQIWLGNIALFQGNPEGEKMVRDSLSIFKTLGEQMGGQAGLVQTSSSLFVLGMYEEARQLMKENLDHHFYDFRQDLFDTMYSISLIHTGRYEEARLYVDRGGAFARKLGEAYGETLALITRAWFVISEKDFEQAEILLNESVQYSRKHEIKELESWSLSTLAITLLLMGKNEKVLPRLQNAILIAGTINSYASKLFALAGLCLWLNLNGKINLGLSTYTYAWQIPLLANSVWWNEHVGVKIEALTGSLSEDEIARAKERFAGMDLDEVITRVMAEI